MKDFILDDIKKMINDPLTYDPIGYAFLDNRYTEHFHQGGSHFYYRLFYYLAQFLQPNFMVELGGWQGTAAAHFAAGYPDATIVTIDHHTDPGDEENKVKMLEAEAQYDNLHYIQGWTTGILADRERGHHALGDAINAYPNVARFGHKIDILFVDSWHMYKEAVLDWVQYSFLLASPSLVICDDISDKGMLRFWNELPGKKNLETIPHPGFPMGFLKYEA